MTRSVPALVLLSLLAHPCESPAKPLAGKKPNVIIVLTDDQGYGDLSCHGNPILKTPNLDRLHAQSVRLTDYHVCPMCSPTRGQLLTGVDCLRNGAANVCGGRDLLRPGLPTLPEAFRAGGYKTGQFGKWHLGNTAPNLPNDKGFDEALYLPGWGITGVEDVWNNDLFNGRYRHNGVLLPTRGYCTDVFLDAAMGWIKERAAKGEPFFCYLATNAPHGPHWVPDKYKALYPGKGQPSAFYGMIANLDENVGRLEQFLDKSGLRDDTILVFFHDNGGTNGVKLYNAGMRGGKMTYYEGGHRAACFVRWPGGGLKPRDLGGLTQVQDLFPTLIDLCGIAAPAAAKFDGISLAAALRGTAAVPDRTLVVQYGDPCDGPYPEMKLAKFHCAVMRGRWRLVHGKELYDLSSDPGQASDVAARHPDVVKALRDHYQRWWAGVEPLTRDHVPVVVGADQGVPVVMTPNDWAGVCCDDMIDVRLARRANGPWHVTAARAGEYLVALRRWPREADAAITAGVPEWKGVDGELAAGKALPIAKARLKVGDIDEARPVRPGDKEVVFSVRLPAGVKLRLQTWFYNADGQELCGAYFTEIKRK
jgi:arylsulfatase